MSPYRYKIIRVLLLCFLFLTRVLWASAGTIRINPTKIRLIIPSGDSKSGTIDVENATDEPLRIKAYVQDWRYTSRQDGTKEFSPAASTSLSCSDWVSFFPSEFTIPSFGRQVLSYTVKVPQEARGGHYAVLFFETLLQEPSLTDPSSIGVMVRIGALFYVEPDGTVKRDALVKNLRVERASPGGALGIAVDFKNSGNVDLTAGGTFHIMNRDGMVFARGEFDKVYTLPEDEAKLSSNWKDDLAEGRYDLVLTIDAGKAQEEAGLERGPVIVKDAALEIGAHGDVVNVGDLK